MLPNVDSISFRSVNAWCAWRRQVTGASSLPKTLEVDVGGGEFNVAYACARLGLRTGFVSKLPDNPVARIILNHARAVGMDVSNVLMEKFDGVGRKGRVGLNFTEVGTGVRASVTMYDRGHSSISLMKPEEINWKDFPARARSGCTPAAFWPRFPTTARR
jgi:sugar/nucleoside kinase (ribokinase family)